MTKDKGHSVLNSTDNSGIDEIYSNIEISWNKSKEDIWNDMSEFMEEDNRELTIALYKRQWFKFSVAASIAILLAIAGLMRFYTKTVYCPAGSHIIADLPDGSTISLNANSTVKYNPYWWNFSRKLTFNGEAFFEVEKGNKFVVISDRGKTSVLGTSFNIYSRDKDYKVTCLTGKVKVLAKLSKDKVVLNPDEHAFIQKDGSLKKISVDAAKNISWIDYNFIFTSAPLRHVFDEIARQYNIKIHLPGSLNYRYTGNFKKEESVEDVLDLVCLPFNFKFVKKGKSEYQIVKNKSLEAK